MFLVFLQLAELIVSVINEHGDVCLEDFSLSMEELEAKFAIQEALKEYNKVSKVDIPLPFFEWGYSSHFGAWARAVFLIFVGRLGAQL